MIYCGDNLTIMRTLADNSVDLCYIDPPFFTQKDWIAFDDRFTSMEAYLAFMEPRIKEIHRVLKKTGSFYLHCDWHADSYLRILCDKIFGYNRMQGKITWKRCAPHAIKKGFDNINDTILYYSKSKKFVFNQPYNVGENLDKFKYTEDDTGRKFYPVRSLEQSQNFKHKGEERNFYRPDGTIVTLSTDIGWRWSQKHIDDEWGKNNYIFYFNSKGNVSYKGYADEYKGKKAHCLWDEIKYLPGSSSEHLGYPTQKPEALLERIIKASSNEGDVILDAFCGCGTTLAVCKRLNRQYIGIDCNPTAIEISKKRLESSVP